VDGRRPEVGFSGTVRLPEPSGYQAVHHTPGRWSRRQLTPSWLPANPTAALPSSRAWRGCPVAPHREPQWGDRGFSSAATVAHQSFRRPCILREPCGDKKPHTQLARTRPTNGGIGRQPFVAVDRVQVDDRAVAVRIDTLGPGRYRTRDQPLKPLTPLHQCQPSVRRGQVSS
jgi:hypothetical protein